MRILTPKQLEVLTLEAKGLDFKEIAKELKISEQVARNYGGMIRIILDCKTNAQAVGKAVDGGLIEL
jgi:DNA-binding CsgD family transcriptional regulator